MRLSRNEVENVPWVVRELIAKKEKSLKMSDASLLGDMGYRGLDVEELSRQATFPSELRSTQVPRFAAYEAAFSCEDWMKKVVKIGVARA